MSQEGLWKIMNTNGDTDMIFLSGVLEGSARKTVQPALGCWKKGSKIDMDLRLEKR